MVGRDPNIRFNEHFILWLLEQKVLIPIIGSSPVVLTSIFFFL